MADGDVNERADEIAVSAIMLGEFNYGIRQSRYRDAV